MTKQAENALKAQCLAVNASCAATNLRRAARVVTQVYARIMAPTGLQSTQFSLLVACEIAGAAPITALADALAMDRTTLTRNLRPLERQGLVRVAPGDDRRVRVVTLSEKGRAVLAQALPLWKQAQEQVVEVFGQERLDHTLQEAGALAALVRET